MAKIIVLGSSAIFPLPRTVSNAFEDYLEITRYARVFELHHDALCMSAKKGGKDKRMRSCMALRLKSGETILFDAGPDIRYQLKREGVHPDAVFITHAHSDADYGLRYLKRVPIFSEKLGTITPGRAVRIGNAHILPFRVVHAANVPCVGYQIKVGGACMVYVSDMASVRGIKRYVRKSNIYFADGSILKRNLPGHLSIVNQLRHYKKWRLKRVIFTHIGHSTIPHADLVKYIQRRYRHAEVAYDGMKIHI